MAFPTNPTNGQTYKNHIWNSTTNAWDKEVFINSEQPSGLWKLNCDPNTYIRTLTIIRNPTGNITSSSVAYGSVGRFTASVSGKYLFTIRANNTPTAPLSLICIYGNFSNNGLFDSQEILDLRLYTDRGAVGDGEGFSELLYLNKGEYFEIDWYRGAPTAYIDSTVILISTILLS